MLDLSKLNPPETAPKNGRQIVALFTIPDNDIPRWGVIQWAGIRDGQPDNRSYWRYSVPGYLGCAAKLLGWTFELPFNDAFADCAIEGASAWEKHGF